ncbi:flavodoxin [Actinomyces sp. ZJ308]|uniref:flavodoxin n=1 Tax=Actinomyces sp. ZJ308 TaxID=2708342 RepID=UPI0014224267|nr:flavodoxin [Actinomyces sp. ZJ308]
MSQPTARRSFIALSSAAALAAIGGCSILGREDESDTPRGKTSQVAVATDSSRMIVVYFSVPETDKTTGLTEEEENSVIVVDGQALGNTQYVAQLIAQDTRAQTARIETVEAYPLDHQQLIDKARKEQDDKARPQIQQLPDMSSYDTIFLGYPIWWSDIPMPLYTFLEQTDLKGKTIIPFSTHGGSGLSGTPEAIAGAASGATVSDHALSISRDQMDGAPQAVTSWLSELGL